MPKNKKSSPIVPDVQKIDPNKDKGFFTRLKEGVFGSKDEIMRLASLTPEQQQVIGEYLQRVPQLLQQADQMRNYNPLAEADKFGGSKFFSGLQNLQSKGYGPTGVEGLLSQTMKTLQNTNFDFAPIAQQARANFMTNTVPSLAERFTAMGGGLSSSSFQNAIGQAGAGLDRDLASLEQQYKLKNAGLLQGLQGNLAAQQIAGRQQQMDLGGLLANLGLSQQNYGLQRSGLGMNQQKYLNDVPIQYTSAALHPLFQTTYTPGQPGFVPSLLGGASGGIGKGSGYLGGLKALGALGIM